MVTRQDRVLLVDDQPANIRVLAEALGNEYDLAFATSGEKALELATGVDLIVLDVVMPDLDGFAVCRRLKSNPITAAIPIIFVTALGDVSDEAHGFDVGGVDYITKPVSPPIVRARVRTHLALKKQKDMLEEVERMSRHDLKTPLNSVISFASLVAEDDAMPPATRDLAAKIEQAGYRILEMVNRSLDLFRMEQGTYAVRAMPIDVTAIAARAAEDLQTADVRCEIRGAAVARGEELLTYSMLANLIKNAVEASPAGSTVLIEIEEGSDVAIRIRNRGAVPLELRDRFFDKYSTGGKRGGTGLGTYSALLMAETQGGSISVDALDDETVVTVRLECGGKAAAFQSGGDAAALLNLVADDDEWSRLALKKMMAGSVVDEAANGADAIAKCKETDYDYVFIDLEMPVQSGLDALPRLKAKTIVAMSSHDDEPTRRRAIEAGAHAYLVKPVTRNDLMRLMNVVLIDPGIAELLPQFLAGKREEIEMMNGGPPELIIKTSHKLKGSFRLYGFEEAARLCGEIEQRATDSRWNDVPGLVESLTAHLERMRIEYA